MCNIHKDQTSSLAVLVFKVSKSNNKLSNRSIFIFTLSKTSSN